VFGAMLAIAAWALSSDPAPDAICAAANPPPRCSKLDKLKSSVKLMKDAGKRLLPGAKKRGSKVAERETRALAKTSRPRRPRVNPHIGCTAGDPNNIMPWADREGLVPLHAAWNGSLPSFQRTRPKRCAIVVDRHVHKNGGSTVRDLFLENERLGFGLYQGGPRPHLAWRRRRALQPRRARRRRRRRRCARLARAACRPPGPPPPGLPEPPRGRGAQATRRCTGGQRARPSSRSRRKRRRKRSLVTNKLCAGSLPASNR